MAHTRELRSHHCRNGPPHAMREHPWRPRPNGQASAELVAASRRAPRCRRSHEHATSGHHKVGERLMTGRFRQSATFRACRAIRIAIADKAAGSSAAASVMTSSPHDHQHRNSPKRAGTARPLKPIDPTAAAETPESPPRLARTYQKASRFRTGGRAVTFLRALTRFGNRRDPRTQFGRKEDRPVPPAGHEWTGTRAYERDQTNR